MRKLTAVAALLALAALAPPAPAVELLAPDEVFVKVGRLVKVELTTDAASVVWVNVHDDVDVIPSESGRWATVALAGPGPYRVVVVAVDAKGATKTHTLTLRPPAPPVPVPPVPPAPTPGPTPPAPDPDQALKARVDAAWAKEAAPERATHARALAQVYREAAAGVRTSASSRAQLAAMRERAKQLFVPETALAAVRRALAAEVQAVLPTPSDLPMPATAREVASALFSRLAAALESLR